MAIDTEFQREKTYYPLPCLIQISDGKHAYLFDVLAFDATPLWTFLKNSSQTKILHSASQDIEVFDILLEGQALCRIFDTQLAARFLMLDNAMSLASIVETLLNQYLEKSQTVSDWSKRPLSKEQLKYAADDVLYLHQLYEILKPKLEASGKYEHFIEDCQSMTTLKDPIDNFCEKNIKVTDSDYHKKLIRSFAQWRENYAKERNIPRGWILKDHQIKKLIKTHHHPTWIETEVLTEKQYHNYKNTFVDIHHHYKGENKKRHQMTQNEKNKIEALLMKLKRQVNKASDALNVPLDLISNQRTIKAIADSMILNGTWKKFKGWRGELLNQKFTQIFESLKPKNEA